MVEATLTESSQRWNNTRGQQVGGTAAETPDPGPGGPSGTQCLQASYGPPLRGASISAHRERRAEAIAVANGVILKG